MHRNAFHADTLSYMTTPSLKQSLWYKNENTVFLTGYHSEIIVAIKTTDFPSNSSVSSTKVVGLQHKKIVRGNILFS